MTHTQLQPGTVGKEILDSGMDFDAIFVPVGGGGTLPGNFCMDFTKIKDENIWS